MGLGFQRVRVHESGEKAWRQEELTICGLTSLTINMEQRELTKK